MNVFSGEVALITGAGRGVGREIALAFSSLGAAVAANDINPLNLDDTVSKIQQAGGNAQPYIFDVAKRMPIEGLLAEALDYFGRIDILVNHASIRPDASILEMDEWDYHRTLDVNLAGPFFTIQQVGRVMQKQGQGSIVNLISTVGQGRYQKGCAAHWASQAGLLGLTQAAAAELDAHHIRVNAVCDGPILPGVVAGSRPDLDKLGVWRESHPEMWLVGHPELVSFVVYLCTQEAASINGQIFTVGNGERS